MYKKYVVFILYTILFLKSSLKSEFTKVINEMKVTFFLNFIQFSILCLKYNTNNDKKYIL